jgi:splicing factor 3B subunit 1
MLIHVSMVFFLFRDLVHRQTACAAIKHMALGVHGFGCEDALIHLLNYVWPNVFETSPHLVQAFMDAVDGLRVSLGPIKILQYALQVCLSTFSIR